MWFSSSAIDFQPCDSRSTGCDSQSLEILSAPNVGAMTLITRRDSQPLEILSSPNVGAMTLDVSRQSSQLFAACLFAIAGVILVSAALADSMWHARAISEIIGWPGFCVLFASIVCLCRSGLLDDRQLTHTTPGDALDAGEGGGDFEGNRNPTSVGCNSKVANECGDSAIVDHPMRDRFLDG